MKRPGAAAWALGAGLLALPALGRTFFDSARSSLLAAAAAGRGGVEAPADPSLDGLTDNPAALPDQGDWHAALLGGAGSGERSQWAFGLSGLPLPGARWGLLYQRLSDPRLSPLTEESAAGVLALDDGAGQSLGLRVNLDRLGGSPDGIQLSGASLDLGWLWHNASLPFLPGSISLGLAADHVAGAWPDDDWARAVPSRLRLGLGWRPLPSLWAGGESLWTVDSALPDASRQDWRAGLEWAPWRPGWLLRAGVRSDQTAGASVGLGLPLPVGLHLDYAALLGPPAVAQRLSLAWDFERSQDQMMRVQPVLVLTDPDSGRVERASFRVSLDARLKARRWSLEISDAQGALRRTLGPQTEGDATVDWDGRDGAGQAIEEGQRVYYALVADTDAGPRRKSYSLALGQAWKAAGRRAIVDAGMPAPRLKPVFAPDGKALQQVLMDMPEAEADGWRVELRDTKNKTLRTFTGLGRVPHELVWDGRDQQGAKVEDPLGVVVDFQLRGEDGSVRSAAQPLFSQQAFEIAQRGVGDKAALGLAPLGLPLVSGRDPLAPSAGGLQPLFDRAARSLSGLAEDLRLRSLAQLRQEHVQAQPDGSVDLDVFDPGSSVLRADRAPLLADWAGAAPRSTLWIQGVETGAEGADPGLARRRAMAAAEQLSGQADQGLQIVLSDAGAPAERAGVRGRSAPAAPLRKDWERLTPAERGRSLAQSRPDEIQARYALAPAEGGLDDRPARPLSAADASALAQRWGLRGGRGLLTEFCPKTGKVAVYDRGWIWLTDRQGTRLRSLWYEPDLAAAGRLRWSDAGDVLWLRADGWRRWASLSLGQSAENPQALAK